MKRAGAISFFVLALTVGVANPVFAGGKTGPLDIAGGILLADLGRFILAGVFGGGFGGGAPAPVYAAPVYGSPYFGDPYPECAGLFGPARQGCEQGAEERRSQLRRQEYLRGYEFGRSGGVYRSY